MEDTSTEDGKWADTSHLFQRFFPAARSGISIAHFSSLEQDAREGSSNNGSSLSVSLSESVMETEHAPISIRNSESARVSNIFLGDVLSSPSSSLLFAADRPRNVTCRSAQESFLSSSSPSSCKLFPSLTISVNDSLDAVFREERLW